MNKVFSVGEVVCCYPPLFFLLAGGMPWVFCDAKSFHLGVGYCDSWSMVVIGVFGGEGQARVC